VLLEIERREGALLGGKLRALVVNDVLDALKELIRKFYGFIGVVL